MAITASTSKEYEKVDVRLCYPFMQAVIDTLSVQCQLSGKMGKPNFKSGDMNVPMDVVALTGMAGEGTLASVALCFSEQMFLEVMGRMLGEKVKEITPDLEDGACEFMNIVFNQAKGFLAKKEYKGLRSIPAVIFSRGMRLHYLTLGRPIILPCDTEIGSIYVEFSTEEQPK